jgi:NAD(P)-dependent dehydrogenase (short-subunit alcohol dehydrogenase family)
MSRTPSRSPVGIARILEEEPHIDILVNNAGYLAD